MNFNSGRISDVASEMKSNVLKWVSFCVTKFEQPPRLRCFLSSTHLELSVKSVFKPGTGYIKPV